MSLTEVLEITTGTIVVFSLIGLAFWRRDMFLYFIGGPAAIVFGFGWYGFFPTPQGMTISLVMVALGFYMLVRAVLMFIEAVK